MMKSRKHPVVKSNLKAAENLASNISSNQHATNIKPASVVVAKNQAIPDTQPVAATLPIQQKVPRQKAGSVANATATPSTPPAPAIAGDKSKSKDVLSKARQAI